MPVLDPAGLATERINAVARFHQRIGVPRAQLDVSGGVDSATMLGIVTRALGPDHVTAVWTAIDSGEAAAARARDAAAAFGVPLVEMDLSAVFADLVEQMKRRLVECGHDPDTLDARVAADPTVLGSLRSCLRAPVGRGLNRLAGGGIRHGTGNECEDRFLRFYQKGGDGEVDTNPIAMLSKGEVYQLARELGVPNSVLEATPSPDLHGTGDDHTDEDELQSLTGVAWTYSAVDAATGRYRSVGTIEQMSRFLDQSVGGARVDSQLFGPDDPDWERLLTASAAGFPDQSEAMRRTLLRSARDVEASTRHKHNPACPTLGDRATLVRLGLLDDTLPTGEGT